VKSRIFSWTCLLALVVITSLRASWAQDGAALYHQRCAVCHEGNAAERAPDRSALQQMPSASIVKVLETGVMRTVAGSLTPAERDAIAEYLTGSSPHAKAEGTGHPPIGLCESPSKSFSFDASAPHWSGWAVDGYNRRFQPAAIAGIAAADVPRLKLKWAFGFDGDTMAYSQPTIVGGRLFVGSEQGAVFSLDAGDGCVKWSFQAETAVRTAITVGVLPGKEPVRYAAYFGDQRGSVYAVDAATGSLLWKAHADPHPQAKITGSVQLWGGRVYVPVASGEENASIDPHYECCSFRGSVVAFDAETGAQVWKTYVIAETPHPTQKSNMGTQLWGPSGGGIWSSPTIDPERKVLYVGTGNSYSQPAAPMSDAIMALDLSTGKVSWFNQLTAHDTYNHTCAPTEKCPETQGPDYDFGSSPILVSLPGAHRILVAGQKSGMVSALDPDQQGKVLWQVRVGEGGTHGGVEFGSAADDDKAYVAVSDAVRTQEATMINGQRMLKRSFDPTKGGGLAAIRLSTGEKVWQTAAPKSGCQNRTNCSLAQSAAVSVIPGVVFSGAMDGHLRAYSANDGHILWDFDTVRDYTTVNGVAAHGGSLDGPGPAIAGGILYVNSGYGGNEMPGNVLLAFSVEGK
jgi:polyvinyl alcohol dehydrogenase (cytochrome)